MSLTFNSPVVIFKFWTDFKALAINSKLLSIQYDIDTESSDQKYVIFAIDGDITYTCYIWLNLIPADFQVTYSQSQNNADRTDFENNYLATTNNRLAPGLVQTSIIENATVIAGGNQTFSGLGNRQVNLFINLTQAPTGTTPGLQFTLQEVDPGDLTTVVGTSITGASLTSGPQTQQISLNLTTSSALKVSWIIVGSNSPTFPGTYVTLTSKPTTVFSGIDANGVERVFQPDSSGRLLVSGSNAVSSAVTVNPIIIGGVNPAGLAGYSQLASDDSLIVTQGTNTQPVFINGTITSSGISNLTSLGVPMVNLFINIKNSPTGTNPAILFSMYEVDPGDKATPLGTSTTGTQMFDIGTQILSLPLTTSGVVQVSWTVTGTNPSFSGVYVTALMKDANVIVGPAADGTAFKGNPVAMGSVDNLGNVQVLSSKMVRGYTSLLVNDELVVNKLDEIILLLTDIRDRKILGE